MKIHSFNVAPNLPDNLKTLSDLSQNMWFTWNWEAIMMFVSIHEDLWHRSHRNPKWLLGNLTPARIEELSRDGKFIEQLEKVRHMFEDYKNKPTWFAQNHAQEENDFLAAYFSMEFGIGEGLPMYSGGLGMLAGDHLKSASDIGLPLVGVGLLYQKGYIQQVLNRDGWQVERYPETDWANMPVQPVKDKDGNPLHVEVPLGNESIKVAVWRVPVGRTSLYLLDTNLPENPVYHRLITEQLYGGDRETRIKQEIVLGLGGVRALDAMGLKPTVFHINEGHSAFLLFERIRRVMRERNISFNEAREIIWTSSVFTTHTPVMAGNEHFDPQLVRKYFESYANLMGISWDDFLSLGKEEPASTTFCMTVVALKLAAYLNGVSKLHGDVSRKMWRKVWPQLPPSEIPIVSITNGVHTPSWISHEHLNLYQQYLGHNHNNGTSDPAASLDWSKIDAIPDEALWQTHSVRKQKMINLIRSRMRRQQQRLGADVTVLEETERILNPDVLTIGFARRFATYKRANLIFRDLDRLASILNNPKMPIQLVFGGKAHQADTEGKELVKFVNRLMSDKRFKGKLFFVEDYNMNVARYFVQGVDVWMNNPIRPLEASGTSGMKASINGVLTLSVLDGWWCEAYEPELGWAVGGAENYNDETERDNVESEAICNLLEKEIAPLYYARDERGLPKKWLGMMRNSVKKITPFFSTHRMVREYYDKFYVPAHRYGKVISSDGKAQETAYWRQRIAENWHRVNVVDITSKPNRELRAGEMMHFRAKVWLGQLSPEDVAVQIYTGKINYESDLTEGVIVTMKPAGMELDAYIYEGEFALSKSGRQDFALRVIPRNANIPHPFMPPYVKWED